MSKGDIDELVRWRDQCEALAASLQRKVRHCDEITEERDKAQRERDEARAEVERMKARPVEAEHTRLDIMWQQLVRERDDAYRAKRDAFRRGAEAMREACADRADGFSSGASAKDMLDLPIPEESC